MLPDDIDTMPYVFQSQIRRYEDLPSQNQKNDCSRKSVTFLCDSNTRQRHKRTDRSHQSTVIGNSDYSDHIFDRGQVYRQTVRRTVVRKGSKDLRASNSSDRENSLSGRLDDNETSKELEHRLGTIQDEDDSCGLPLSTDDGYANTMRTCTELTAPTASVDTEEEEEFVSMASNVQSRNLWNTTKFTDDIPQYTDFDPQNDTEETYLTCV